MSSDLAMFLASSIGAVIGTTTGLALGLWLCGRGGPRV